MSLLKIVTWPNPILDAPGDPVTKFDDDLKKLVNNMFETMYAAPGVGLAAVQVGVPRRLFVMDCSGGKDPAQRVVMINPEVVSIEGKQDATKAVCHFPASFSTCSVTCARSFGLMTSTATNSNLTTQNLPLAACFTKLITATASSFSTR